MTRTGKQHPSMGDTKTLVADFLARGGIIRKVPPPDPTVAEDVLRYLQERKVDVQRVKGCGEAELSYVYKSRVINLKMLTVIANRHRGRRYLPPFELTPVI